MELSYLKKLIRLLEQSKIDEIEVEEEGIKIRISKHSAGSAVVYPSQVVQPLTQPVQPQHSPHDAAAAQAAPPAKPEVKYHEVKSPIVGTFYRAPAPDADPYVEVGQAVQAGTVLCIIEAMKLMNEIECDIAGRIVKIAVENGQPVEYNQTLFFIEPV
ncbi:MAG: acetyl-CoA carboxylase biotin carboxyl carrier protein [Bacteroidota bacterium]|jgi:acetyl-CoA carboxylase biotin carboxyl carrier protein